MKQPSLQTARLLLRPFRPEDLDGVAAYFSDPGFLRYLGPGFPGAEEFLANNVDPDRTQGCGFAIDHEGVLVGSVHLGCERPNMIGELACLISPCHWGDGIAFESCAAVIDYGFERLNLAKVYARADARNAGSIAAMKKLGMRLEGRLRENRVDREGNRVDEVAYGLLCTEWRAQAS